MLDSTEIATTVQQVATSALKTLSFPVLVTISSGIIVSEYRYISALPNGPQPVIAVLLLMVIFNFLSLDLKTVSCTTFQTVSFEYPFLGCFGSIFITNRGDKFPSS
eukprot:Gb_01910 [translate_table: standard]